MTVSALPESGFFPPSPLNPMILEEQLGPLLGNLF